MTTNSSPEHILQVGLGFWASKTLLSAVEMEFFTELAKKAEDLVTLRGRLGLHPRSARDFLDALTALGFLCRVGGKYANTPAGSSPVGDYSPKVRLSTRFRLISRVTPKPTAPNALPEAAN